MPKCDFDKVGCFWVQRDLRDLSYRFAQFNTFNSYEINLFKILIIKSFIRKREGTFDLQTAWWKISLSFLRAKNNLH